MTKRLKEGFLWGNSVSSMQTEGAVNEGGKGPSIYDIREAGENTSDWSVATDSYHRYEEDFDLMKEMGMNAYRFQISWSRVIPDGDGEVNEEGLAFYDRFIDGLLERGIEPMICMYHFDMPLALAEKYDGFLSRNVMEAFVRYGKILIDRYKHKVTYWLTFNEHDLFANPGISYRIAGVLNTEFSEKAMYQIQHHVMVAHAKLANYLHQTTDCEVGGMIAYSPYYPASSHPKDTLAADLLDDFTNHAFLHTFTHGEYPAYFTNYLEDRGWTPTMEEDDLEEMKQMKSDWLAFSYYSSNVINGRNIPEGTPITSYGKYGGEENPHLDRTEWNWQIDPIAFRLMMRDMYARYRLPLFPIENGIGVIEELPEDELIQDDYRIAYHRDHIQAMKDAILIDGVECIGYLGWGLIDILSSQGDMRKRYGMVYVNRENHDLKDLRRIPKKSFYWMKQVTETNGEDLSDI